MIYNTTLIFSLTVAMSSRVAPTVIIHTAKIFKTEQLKKVTVVYHSSHHSLADAQKYIASMKGTADIRIIDKVPNADQIKNDYKGYTYNNQYVVPSMPVFRSA